MTGEVWYTLEEKEPQVGDVILAELNGSKVYFEGHIVLKIREGEGLGHIKRWRIWNEKREEIK